MKCFYLAQNSENLLSAQDAGQAFFSLGFQNFEKMPVSLQYVPVEKLDSAIGYFQCARSPFIFIAPVEKIVFQFPFGDFGRFFSVEIDQLAHGSGVHVLCCVTFSGELKCPEGFRVPFCLDDFRDCFRCGIRLRILVFTRFSLHDNAPFIEEN